MTIGLGTKTLVVRCDLRRNRFGQVRDGLCFASRLLRANEGNGPERPMPDAAMKQRILFLCTGNSCRSQMAEGFLRELAGDAFESLSAGSNPAGFVHPLAVEVMREAGIDISAQRSKKIDEFLPPRGTPPDVIVSVCSSAEKECPAFPGRVERRHWPFDDPAHVVGNTEERMAAFRRVRDEIRAAIEQFIQEHRSSGP